MYREKLKLFVWEGVLKDYTSGMMVALAPSVEEARKMLREKGYYLPDDDVNSEPSVHEDPCAFFCWGGG